MGKLEQRIFRQRLAKGINLAAEFIDNPFSEAFKETEAQVRKQQDFETPMIKQVLHVTDLLPEESETVEKLMSAAKKHEDANFEAVRASLKPVRHQITIEAVK